MRPSIVLVAASSAIVAVLAHNDGLHHGNGIARRHLDSPGMIRRTKDKRQNILQDAFDDATSALGDIFNPQPTSADTPSRASSAIISSDGTQATSAATIATTSATAAVTTTSDALIEQTTTTSQAPVSATTTAARSTARATSSPSSAASSSAPASMSSGSVSASSSAASASASSAESKDDEKSSGLPRTTLIIIIVVASSIALIAAVWTIIRKVAFSPSRKFEAKLAPIEWDDPAKPGRRDSYVSAGAGPLLARNGSMGSDKDSLRHNGSMRGDMQGMGYPASIPYQSPAAPLPHGGPAYVQQHYSGSPHYANSSPGYPTESAYRYNDLQRGPSAYGSSSSRLPSNMNYAYSPPGGSYDYGRSQARY